jgi:O-antigen ligase
LSYLIFCLVEAAGYLHTHNLTDQGKIVSKEATLVAVSFAFCSVKFIDAKLFRRLLGWYYLLLTASSLYCLVVAVRNYRLSGDRSVFFYHLLTRPISQNAVFYCVYVVFGICLLLAPFGEPAVSYISGTGRKGLRIGLIVFLLGMVVLLNSKLLLVVALLLLIRAALRRYSFREHRRTFLLAGVALIALVAGLAVTKNPISDRYRDMQGDLEVIRRPAFGPDMYFNPLQLRLLEFRFASEILHEQHALAFGVSSGDSQDLLDQKYVQTHMYIGNPADGPNRHIRGFLGYNFHNQYLETLVRSGLLGLAALVGIFVTLFGAARRRHASEASIIVLILAIFFIPEAPLTLQHGVFIFCFLPLFALATPQKP